MAELTFTFEVDGEPVSADSVVLSDPDGDYGFRNADTSEIIVEADEPMVEGDDGEYTYDLGDFEIDDTVNYEWWAKVSYDNDTYYVQKFIRPTGGGEDPGGTKTLRFVVVDSTGVPVLATAVKLSDPSAIYGVTRLDSGAIVVADNTAFTASGTLYSYGFTEPATGLVYRYYVEVLIDGVTYYLPRTTAYVSSAMLAIGRYTDSHRIEQAFGVESVHKWLGIDATDEAADYAMRAYQFIADAEAEVDDLLRGGPCTVPFTSSIPATITTIATAFAAVRMYEARGVVDMDQESGTAQHRLQYHKKEADKLISKIKAGQLRLSVETVTRHPIVINDGRRSDCRYPNHHHPYCD